MDYEPYKLNQALLTAEEKEIRVIVLSLIELRSSNYKLGEPQGQVNEPKNKLNEPTQWIANYVSYLMLLIKKC